MKAEIIAEMNDKMLNRRYEIMYLNKQKISFKTCLLYVTPLLMPFKIRQNRSEF